MTDPLAPIALATIRDGESVAIEADAALRSRIAQRLGLRSIDRFAATATLSRQGEAVSVNGHLEARVEQACIASGEPVAAEIDEAFTMLFAPQPRHDEGEEIELGVDDLDTIFHDGREIPLGDALVDTLGLALDPFPRASDADRKLRDAGVLSEEEAGKFGALAELKKKMEGGGD